MQHTKSLCAFGEDKDRNAAQQQKKDKEKYHALRPSRQLGLKIDHLQVRQRACTALRENKHKQHPH
jgi:hypothetical protein